MKVKIKDLQPNPFRDIKNYPINPAKIESLKKSINQTGFWDNILARKNNGKIEIAYGHHRLKVLKELFKPDYEIDISIKDLDDAMMIRIMANENDESWGTSPKIIDETVRVARDFLKKRPEFSPRRKFQQMPGTSIEAQMISAFLGGNWGARRVYYSLERLGLIKNGIIDKEAIENLPTERTARNFVRAIKKTKNVTSEQQRKAAKKIIETQNFGEDSIQEIVFEEKYRMEEKAEEKERIRRQEFEYHLKQITKKTDSLYHDLIGLLEYKDILLSDYYQKSKEGQDFIYSIARLFDTFRILMSTEEKKSDLFESFKLLIESKKEKFK